MASVQKLTGHTTNPPNNAQFGITTSLLIAIAPNINQPKITTKPTFAALENTLVEPDPATSITPAKNSKTIKATAISLVFSAKYGYWASALEKADIFIYWLTAINISNNPNTIERIFVT